MVPALLTLVTFGALVITGCASNKLFTQKIIVECSQNDLVDKPPSPVPNRGKLIDQNELPSKELKRPSSDPTISSLKNRSEENVSPKHIQTRFVIPVADPAEESCITDDKDADAIAQDTDVWCWAASSETVMRFHTQSPNKNQCNIVNTIFKGGDPSGPDSGAFCCGDQKHRDCQKTGLPSWALDAYDFDWKIVKGPLQREKIAGQLCSNGPFIFVLRYTGGGGHSFVVRDYDYDERYNQLYLWVHDHSSAPTSTNGRHRGPSRYVRWTYEDYVAGRWGGKTHEHYVNYVRIKPPLER